MYLYSDLKQQRMFLPSVNLLKAAGVAGLAADHYTVGRGVSS